MLGLRPQAVGEAREGHVGAEAELGVLGFDGELPVVPRAVGLVHDQQSVVLHGPPHFNLASSIKDNLIQREDKHIVHKGKED